MEITDELRQATGKFLQTVSSFSEAELNKLPFKGSWTAAQVAEHVKKSNLGMINTLSSEGGAIDRDPAARVQELKDIFLNFEIKLQSPQFIIPAEGEYKKAPLVKDLHASIEQILELSRTVNRQEGIKHPIFGEITRQEILHFIVYHTQRHLRQLNNIASLVKA